MKEKITDYRNWITEARFVLEQKIEDLSQKNTNQKKKKMKSNKTEKCARTLEFFRNCCENLEKIEDSITRNIYVFRQCVSLLVFAVRNNKGKH